MSKLEILDELPRLSAFDRAEIPDRLWRMEEAGGPAEHEREALDDAQAAYDADRNTGAPWDEVEARLRGRA